MAGAVRPTVAASEGYNTAWSGLPDALGVRSRTPARGNAHQAAVREIGGVEPPTEPALGARRATSKPAGASRTIQFQKKIMATADHRSKLHLAQTGRPLETGDAKPEPRSLPANAPPARARAAAC